MGVSSRPHVEKRQPPVQRFCVGSSSGTPCTRVFFAGVTAFACVRVSILPVDSEGSHSSTHAAGKIVFRATFSKPITMFWKPACLPACRLPCLIYNSHVRVIGIVISLSGLNFCAPCKCSLFLWLADCRNFTPAQVKSLSVGQHGFDDPIANNVVCAGSAHHVLAIDVTTCFNPDDYVGAFTGHWWSVSVLDDEDWRFLFVISSREPSQPSLGSMVRLVWLTGASGCAMASKKCGCVPLRPFIENPCVILF